MDVGQLKITGSIDTLNIEKGINGIILDMKKTDEKAQSVNSDFERMNSNANSLATTLGLIGASDALINLAKQSPQVAGDMASIQMSMLQLGLAVGQALKPMFDWFAGALAGFVQWAQDNPDLFGDLTQGIVALSAAVAAVTLGSGLVTLLGFLATPFGLTMGTIALGIWAVVDAYNALKEIINPASQGDQQKALLQVIGGAAGAIIGGIAGGPVGAIAGYVGGSTLLGALWDLRMGGASSSSATTGTFSSGGQMYSGSPNQQTATNSSQNFNDYLDNIFTQQSRRTTALNLSSFNAGY